MDPRFAGLAKAAYLPPGSESGWEKPTLPGPRTGTPLEIRPYDQDLLTIGFPS